ncbi:MAG: nitroreductase [Bacteroidota bacterium]
MNTGKIVEESVANETLNSIYERRSVRKFKDKPVDHEIIEQIVDAGRMAPSAMNKQPWKFYILTNKETIRSFSKEISRIAIKDVLKAGPRKVIQAIASLLHFNKTMNFFKEADPVFHGAPVVVFIAAPADNEWAPLDIGMCSQNMMLAAQSLGLDSCPVGFGKYAEHTKLYPILHIPASEQLHLCVVFGYGDESPELHKRITNNAVFIE